MNNNKVEKYSFRKKLLTFRNHVSGHWFIKRCFLLLFMNVIFTVILICIILQSNVLKSSGFNISTREESDGTVENIPQEPEPETPENQNTIIEDFSWKNPSCRRFCEIESLKMHCPPEIVNNFDETTKWYFKEIGNVIQIRSNADKGNHYHQKSNCSRTCSEVQISQHKNVSSKHCSDWAKNVSSKASDLYNSLNKVQECSNAYVFGYEDCQDEPMQKHCPRILNHDFSPRASHFLQTIEENTEISPLIQLVHVLDPIEITYSGGSKCLDICRKKLTNYEFKVRFHYRKSICRLYMSEIEDRALDPQNYRARSKVITSDGPQLRTIYDGFSFNEPSYALERPEIRKGATHLYEEAKNLSDEFFECSSYCKVRKLYKACPQILDSTQNEAFAFNLGQYLPVEDILAEDIDDMDCLNTCLFAVTEEVVHDFSRRICYDFRDKFLRDSIRLTIQGNFAEKCSDGYAFVTEIYHDWSWKSLGKACSFLGNQNLTETAVNYLESKKKLKELPVDVQFIYVSGSFEAKSTRLNERLKICKRTDSDNEMLDESEMREGLCKMYLEELEAKAAHPKIPRPKTKKLVEEKPLKSLKVRHVKSRKPVIDSTLCAKLCTKKFLLNSCATQLHNVPNVEVILQLYNNLTGGYEIIEGVKMENVVDHDCLEMCKISPIGTDFSDFCDAFRTNSLSTMSVLLEYLEMKSLCEDIDGVYTFFSDLDFDFKEFCPVTLGIHFSQNALEFLKRKNHNLELPPYFQLVHLENNFKFIYQFGDVFSKICIKKGADDDVEKFIEDANNFRGICEMYMESVEAEARDSSSPKTEN